MHREGVPFDADARKNAEGTLCGCQGDLTMQPRKRGSFPASFSYGTPAKPASFWNSVLRSAVHPVGLLHACHARHLGGKVPRGAPAGQKHRVHVLAVVLARKAGLLAEVQGVPGQLLL